jgi:hypothetical protein
VPVRAGERGHDAEAPPAGRAPTTQNAEHAQGAPAVFLDLWRANPLGQAFGAQAAERVAIHHRLALELLEIIGTSLLWLRPVCSQSFPMPDARAAISLLMLIHATVSASRSKAVLD